MASNISLVCVNLPIYNDNTSFCDIEQTWTPRISKTISLIALIVPTFFAWSFTAIIIFKIWKPLEKVYKNKLSPNKRFEDRSSCDQITLSKGKYREREST